MTRKCLPGVLAALLVSTPLPAVGQSMDGVTFKCKMLTMDMVTSDLDYFIDFRTKTVSSSDPASLPDKATINKMFGDIWRNNKFSIKLSGGMLVQDGVRGASASIPLPYEANSEVLRWASPRPMRINQDGVEAIIESEGEIDLVSYVVTQKVTSKGAGDTLSMSSIAQCAVPR